MFGNMTMPRRILAYDTAIQVHDAIKPIRGRAEDTRPLAHRSNDNLVIRRGINGDVVVRLYYTDIITYKVDGTIELEPYGSTLTNRVMWSLLGPRIHTMWGCPWNVTKVGGRYYNTPNYAVLSPTANDGLELTAGNKPFTVQYVDRKAARLALAEAGYYEFKLWLDTLIRLNLDPRRNQKPYLARFGNVNVLECLKMGEEGWHTLAPTLSTAYTLGLHYQHIRAQVYKYAGCYVDKTFPYFDDVCSLQAAIRQAQRG